MGMEYKGAQSHLASGSWTTVVTAATGKSNVIKLAQATRASSPPLWQNFKMLQIAPKIMN